MGKLLGSRAMIFRTHVGEAEDGEGNTYELSASISDLSPMVKNKKTGITYSITWDDLITLAKEAGVDDPAKDMVK